MIKTTDEHPFGATTRGWTHAELLEETDRISGPAEIISAVTSNARAEHPEGIEVHNMEIEGTRTYFVRAEGSDTEPVWVHNADYLAPRPYTASEDGIRLFNEAKAYRASLSGDLTYRNITTADVILDGEARTVRFINDEYGMHSEQRLVAWDQAMRNQGSNVQVLRAFTERIPCGDESANCTELLQNRYGGDFEVYYSQRSGPTR